MARPTPAVVDIDLRLGEVRVLSVRPGDVVFVTVPREIDDIAAFADSTRECLREAGVPDDVRVLVASAGTSVDVLRREADA